MADDLLGAVFEGAGELAGGLIEGGIHCACAVAEGASEALPAIAEGAASTAASAAEHLPSVGQAVADGTVHVLSHTLDAVWFVTKMAGQAVLEVGGEVFGDSLSQSGASALSQVGAGSGSYRPPAIFQRQTVGQEPIETDFVLLEDSDGWSHVTR
tara:strand:+ start:998 stop:1462 length:465 start_codon:yes stop_codon:yes gene_type:complete